jgi:protoporphyrin/coproporphyrin ferrochelatase
MKTGVLLINVGTPDAPTPEKVKTYLDQFLMDPYVIDLPYPLRWFLVKKIITPKRSHVSSEAYQKIWGDSGSPLKYFNEELRDELSAELG